jgi:endonuclease I
MKTRRIELEDIRTLWKNQHQQFSWMEEEDTSADSLFFGEISSINKI